MRLRVPWNITAVTILRVRTKIACGSLLLLATIPASSQASSPNDNESWTSSAETTSSTMAPSRELETHSRIGNRVLDTRTVEVRGPGGSYEMYSVTESEVIQENATNSRLIVRSYAPGPGGERQLTQVSEEMRTAAAGGNRRTVRTISEPDSLGNLQVVQRDTNELTRTAAGMAKSRWVRFTRDPAGTFIPSMQTDEVESVQDNGEVRLTSKMSVPDVSGAWQVIEQKQRIARDRGQRVEVITWQPDFEGKMTEVARVLTQDSHVNGRKVETVETYSIDTTGAVRDGTLRLVNRSTNTQESAPGRATTEETIEQAGGPTNVRPGELQIMTTISHAAVPKQSGTEETTATRTRNLDGNFTIVSEETRQSKQMPIQIQMSPADRPK